ncbi:hypothetical protein EYR36_003688 [Pleurotus pulmonarius]|nr:hypothetical protein EYR36_003688 [Pleurotus pulmonarius]
MTPFSAITALLAFVACVAAKDIWIQVGANKTNDATTVFQPQRVTAKLGDTVIRVFFCEHLVTNGNHSATQSTFSAPCIRAHDSNITINGFDSMFRDAGNGTAVTILAVPMLPDNVNKTMWFYDRNTCGAGGVGVINNDENTTETLDGFEVNAIFSLSLMMMLETDRGPPLAQRRSLEWNSLVKFFGIAFVHWYPHLWLDCIHGNFK